MKAGSILEPQIAQHIAAIRRFNRFYTARLGLLRRRHLDSEFTLTEARILYEIAANPGTRALKLCELLELDAGYMSRMLTELGRKKLLLRVRSKEDGREKHLTLTEKGAAAVTRLNEQSDRQLRELLERAGGSEREELVAALAKVQRILTDKRRGPVRIERLTKVSDAALRILEEYYEAVHVVWRDDPEAVQKLLEEPASGMWLAHMDGALVGCVLLRRLDSIPLAAECKRLYVRPQARGHRIADRLMDALEDFARNAGMKWIYLDTYDELKPAIALYERLGYQRCKRYNENPQATLFMRKRIAQARQNARVY
jgi:DNA-binding MarR family transcriptional regulator/ribosomal protein S18 acetylase RimI-like enzyme